MSEKTTKAQRAARRAKAIKLAIKVIEFRKVVSAMPDMEIDTDERTYINVHENNPGQVIYLSEFYSNLTEALCLLHFVDINDGKIRVRIY